MTPEQAAYEEAERRIAARAGTGEYFIGEGAVLTTVHFIAVDVEFCGRLLSAKVFLRLVAGLRKWSQNRGGKTFADPRDHRG